MRRLFLPNLDFETQLLTPNRSVRGAAKRAVDDLGPAMGLLADEGDQVLLAADCLPGDVPKSLSHVEYLAVPSGQETSFVPWGWSPAITSRAQEIGAANEGPADAIVRLVNGREFHERVDGVRLADSNLQLAPFGRFCRTMDEWRAEVSGLLDGGEARVVSKALISNAGRNRLFSLSTVCNAQQEGWLQQQFAQGGCYVEPWQEVLEEFSLHFDICNAGNISYVGCTGQCVDAFGRHQGNMVYSQGDEQVAGFRANVEAVCEAIRDEGYFGPVGIDGYTFNKGGQTWVRPCSDVNARWSMGRLTLAAHARFAVNSEAGCLLCLTSTKAMPTFQQCFERLEDRCQATTTNVIRTSPFLVGKRPVQVGTVFLSDPAFDRKRNSRACDQIKYYLR